MENIINAFKNYAIFHGRANRKEYWYFAIFTIVVYIPVVAIERLTGDTNHTLELIIAAIFFLPLLSASVRRLHDAGINGWMILVDFIPYIGIIAHIILMSLNGDKNENEYGPSQNTIKN
jgi:uncharacterized membrane protein YhaH (DUF805 family)